jgi:hypothetical protein
MDKKIEILINYRKIKLKQSLKAPILNQRIFIKAIFQLCWKDNGLPYGDNVTRMTETFVIAMYLEEI